MVRILIAIAQAFTPTTEGNGSFHIFSDESLRKSSAVGLGKLWLAEGHHWRLGESSSLGFQVNPYFSSSALWLGSHLTGLIESIQTFQN